MDPNTRSSSQQKRLSQSQSPSDPTQDIIEVPAQPNVSGTDTTLRADVPGTSTDTTLLPGADIEAAPNTTLLPPEAIVPTTSNAWDRRPEESDRDWGLFILYRDLHPSVRSAAKAHALYQKHKHESDPALTAQGKQVQLILQHKAPVWVEQVSVKHQWVSRSRAYDEWRDRDQLERLQSTRVRSLVETATIGRELREKAAQALEHLRTLAHEIVTGPDGEPMTVTVSTLSPAAIVQLAKAGTDLERLAIGLQQAAGGGVNVQIANIVGGASAHIPIPGSDQELMQKVLEVAEARGVLIDHEPTHTHTQAEQSRQRHSSPGKR